ncbi:hypothetical protein BSKO_01410 [Bryopsis sp. KO-2023]|nr:hypothetical protein BSKO_01410 [Bryopsis sp. KO-2023]
MATLPLVTVPSIESNKSPEPYRSIEKVLTVAIDRALEECEERSKAFQSLKICNQQFLLLEQDCELFSESGTLAIFGTETGELLALYPFEDQNAAIHNIGETSAEECDASVVALASVSTTDNVVVVTSLLPSKLEIRRFTLHKGNEPIVALLGHASIEKEAGPSLTLEATINIHPTLNFIAFGGPGPDLLLFEVPSPLREALSQDEVADFEPLLLPSILSISEATARSFLQDPGIVGKTIFEFVRADRRQSGNAIRKPKEVNRFVNFVQARAHAITCSDVSQDGDWIAFGMENGKVLVWDVAEGNSKMLSCSIGSIVVGVKLQVYERRPCVATVGAEGQFLVTDIQRNNIILSKYIHLDIVEVRWMGLENRNSVPMIYCRDGEWVVFDDARDLTQMERPYELDTGSTHRLVSASNHSGWFFLGMTKQREKSIESNSSDTAELDERKEEASTEHQSEEEPQDNATDPPIILAYDLSSASTVRWPKKPEHRDGEENVAQDDGDYPKHCHWMNKVQKDAVAAVDQRMSQAMDHDPKHKMGLLRTRLGGDGIGVAHLA